MKKSDYPSRDDYIRAILNGESDQFSKVALACKAFIEAQERYRGGEGDVIAGLRHLDDLEADVESSIRKQKASGALFDEVVKDFS